MRPASLFSQGSSERTQGATEVEAPVEGDSSLIQGGEKNKGKPNTDVSSSYASVVVGHRNNTTGRGVEGKMKSALGGAKIWSESSRNPSKKSVLGQREQVGKKIVSDSRCAYRDSCKASTLGQRELLGAKVLSTVKEIESDGMKSEQTLDLFMRLERGLDGSWAIVWSEVNEVGPNSLKPSKPIKLIPSSPNVPAKPSRVWRPRQNPKTLNPAHRQSSNPVLVAHDLGFRLKMPMEDLVPRVGLVGSCSREEEARPATTRNEDLGPGIVGEAPSSADKAIIGAGEELSGLSSPDTGSPHRLGLLELGVTGDLVIGSELVRNGSVSNGLTPIEDLGNMLKVQLREGETNVEEVDSVEDFQAESGLTILPRESSGGVVSGCGSGENDNCVLDCEPLSLWAPFDPNVGTLTQDFVEGAQRNVSGPHLD
ncbi:hypothetical protein CMV_018663 [Castanea mollissima]|uniref:Uncharacterized protein n=1 Tax=Castanea mollissima TaxID=60419 RepID=A0A8J4QMC5_9ROSI|nr:hypothetical protein CMV_018663 [Castanea mollissima]